MRSVSQNIDRVDVVFDEPNLVANAGLVTVATLMTRLGLERLIEEMVRLVGRVGGANPGGKILTLVATCRCYGMSRTTFNNWLNRYEDHGEDGDGMTGTARFRS